MLKRETRDASDTIALRRTSKDVRGNRQHVQRVYAAGRADRRT